MKNMVKIKMWYFQKGAPGAPVAMKIKGFAHERQTKASLLRFVGSLFVLWNVTILKGQHVFSRQRVKFL